VNNTIKASFGVCPECGYIHPPDPSGRCPMMAKKNKEEKTPEPEQIKDQSTHIIKKEPSEFDDLIDKIVEISKSQMSIKNIKKEEDIKKFKQYVIIELTKAFERYPSNQVHI